MLCKRAYKNYLVGMFAKIISLFFSNYISLIVRKDFSAFSFNKPALESGKAVLLFANHFSWWDGFLLFHLNRTFLKKRFFVMVTEENYNKVFFLKYLGAFPVKRNSREMIASLEYAGQLLKDERNLVLIFPQGRLFSNHVDEVEFQKGLVQIIKAADRSFQYLFAAMFVDYFQKRKPSVYCYLKVWDEKGDAGLESIKGAYNNHYQRSRQQHNRITV